MVARTPSSSSALCLNEFGLTKIGKCHHRTEGRYEWEHDARCANVMRWALIRNKKKTKTSFLLDLIFALSLSLEILMKDNRESTHQKKYSAIYGRRIVQTQLPASENHKSSLH